MECSGFSHHALEHSFSKPPSSKPFHKIYIAPGCVLFECNRYVHRVTAQPTAPARISAIPTSVLRRHPHKTLPAPAVLFLPHTILLHWRPKPIHSGFSFR